MIEYVDPRPATHLQDHDVLHANAETRRADVAPEAERKPDLRPVRGQRTQHRRRQSGWIGKRFDATVVPGGAWCEHVNASAKRSGDPVLASDEPALKALAFYQKHGRNRDGGHRPACIEAADNLAIGGQSWPIAGTRSTWRGSICPRRRQVWIDGHILYVGQCARPAAPPSWTHHPKNPKVLARIEMPPGWHSQQGAGRERHMIVNTNAREAMAMRLLAAGSAFTTCRALPHPESASGELRQGVHRL